VHKCVFTNRLLISSSRKCFDDGATAETANVYSQGRNFVAKCGGTAWCETNIFIGSMQKWLLSIQIPNLVCRGVLRATLLTLCFILADDLRINILKFVAGHGAVVQPASINIVFGYKQAQQYSRKHQLGFIRAVSWNAQNAESHWSHVHITLTPEHFNFHAFYEKCGLQRDLMSCSSRLTLQRRWIFFWHISNFWKSYKSFLCYWMSGMQPHPHQNLHWYPLTSAKNIWPKIIVAYFTKWFQSIFTVGRWRMHP